MMKNILLFFISLTFTVSIYSQEKPNTKYWIYFKDKGKFTTGKVTPGSAAYEAGKSLLTEKAIKRRLKVLSEESLIDFGDLPLEEKYINGITKLNINLVAKSRWLNGVSAYLTPSQVKKIKELNFVSEVTSVRKLNKQEFINPIDLSFNEDNFFLPQETHKLDYGKSLKQLELVNVPKVHDLNITGKGVFLANIDDGFEWRSHQALNTLSVLGEHDFVNDDDNTFKEERNKFNEGFSQGDHGTATLSCMSARKDGKLYGPSFDADILLAKTEFVASETPMEEDFWLEAAEWVESQGVDVVTSSLNYRIFDAPYDSNTYKYTDLNGNRAICTIAADRCAYLGIVVCNSMGNYYQTDVPSITTPADADSIISVGAISPNGKIAGFSSNGPTADGRTKPDVVAPGVDVWVAVSKNSSGNDSTYKFGNGTSFATPITAGVCGLILSAHPELTPLQVREALRNTANNSATPNNVYGWGLINAYDAILYWGPVWSNEPEVEYKNGGMYIRTYLVSKDVIDTSKVIFAYNFETNNFIDYNMKLIENLNDGNYSGRYEVFIKDINTNDNSGKYQFITETTNDKIIWDNSNGNPQIRKIKK
ncbi:MAG: S8 family serine peptidase [Bacteroidetes bacterium]|nr:S8 family serine peptidase [Bacteroidota bacterium]